MRSEVLLLPQRRGPERPGGADLQGSLDISSFPVLGRGEASPILLLPLLSSLPWAFLMNENTTFSCIKSYPTLKVFQNSLQRDGRNPGKQKECRNRLTLMGRTRMISLHSLCCTGRVDGTLMFVVLHPSLSPPPTHPLPGFAALQASFSSHSGGCTEVTASGACPGSSLAWKGRTNCRRQIQGPISSCDALILGPALFPGISG